MQQQEMKQREQSIQTACLLILTVFAIGFVLYWLRPVMLPFVLAVMFALGLTPLIDLQIKYLRFPRWAAVAGAMLAAVVVLSLLGVLVSTSVARLVANAGAYQEQIAVLIDNTLDALPLQRFGIDPDTVLDRVPLQTVGPLLVGTGNALIDILSQGLLVLVFVFFFLVGEQAGTAPQVGAAPRAGVWGQVEPRIKRYIVVKSLVSGFTGLAVGIILATLQIDLAMVFGLFAFLLNFIPSFGSIVATLLPLPVVLVSPEVGALQAVLALALPAAVQMTVGNLIEPKILGQSLDLHPVVVLMSLVVWGMLWGPVGMLLAAPLTAVFQIIFARIELLRPIAELMAGRMDALVED